MVKKELVINQLNALKDIEIGHRISERISELLTLKSSLADKGDLESIREISNVIDCLEIMRCDVEHTLKEAIKDEEDEEDEEVKCCYCEGPCKPQEDCPEVWVCCDKNCKAHTEE